jgi:hypothetical protein
MIFLLIKNILISKIKNFKLQLSYFEEFFKENLDISPL